MFWKFLLINAVVAAVYAKDFTGFKINKKDVDLRTARDLVDGMESHLLREARDADVSNGESSEMTSEEENSHQGRTSEARVDAIGNSDTAETTNGKSEEAITQPLTEASTEPSTSKRSTESVSTTKQTSEAVSTMKPTEDMDTTSIVITTEGLDTTTEENTTDTTDATTTNPDDNGSLHFTPSLVFVLFTVLSLQFI